MDDFVFSSVFNIANMMCQLVQLGTLGDCKPALPIGRKYKMVKTQTESYIRRPVV